MKNLNKIWRPALMLVLIAIVALNFLIMPVAGLFISLPLLPPLPDQLWTLLTAVATGYTVGRSGEKIVAKYKETG